MQASRHTPTLCCIPKPCCMQHPPAAPLLSRRRHSVAAAVCGIPQHAPSSLPLLSWHAAAPLLVLVILIGWPSTRLGGHRLLQPALAARWVHQVLPQLLQREVLPVAILVPRRGAGKPQQRKV